MITWRIATDAPEYTADDLSGSGSKITGGRWNSKNNAVLYTASSVALAALETVVHLNAGSLPLNRYLVRIDIPDDLWADREIFDVSKSVGWDAIPPGMVSIAYGDAWLKRAESLILQVPSVIVPEEFNILINPAHADIKHISATKLRRFQYDARLLT